MLSRKISIIAIYILLGSYSIAALYTPTAKDAKAQNVKLEYLNQGRSLYINSCSTCHKLHLPSEYTQMQWVMSINKMQKRAKINDQQKEMITRYLFTNAKCR